MTATKIGEAGERWQRQNASTVQIWWLCFSPHRDGNPPDPTQGAGTQRNSELPMGEIVSGIQSVFTAAEVHPSIDTSGDAGNFLCEYLGYHVAWYREYINAKYPDDPDKKCLKSGFTHVGGKVTAANAETAVRIQLEKLFEVLP